MEAFYNEIVSFVDEYPWLKQYGVYGALTASLVLYGALLAVYRLYFHPLAGFPGPKIAAASRWYEFYYDVIKRGQYVYKIEEMHQKYGKVQFQYPGLYQISDTSKPNSRYFILSGPVIRINPHEIVINDPEFYNSVYVAGNTRRTAIWPRYRTGIGFDGTFTPSLDLALGVEKTSFPDWIQAPTP
jgi:hypothetical protein